MKYILLNKINGIYILMQDDKMIASSDSDFQSDYQIGKLSIDNCDEVFGIINKHKLAEETYNEYPNNPKDKPEWHYNRDVNCFKKRKAFVKGFDKAMELNKDKLFTEDDLRLAMHFGKFGEVNGQTTTIGFIQSLQQPKEIEVIIEQVLVQSSIQGEAIWRYKLDENLCLILKKL